MIIDCRGFRHLQAVAFNSQFLSSMPHAAAWASKLLSFDVHVKAKSIQPFRRQGSDHHRLQQILRCVKKQGSARLSNFCSLSLTSTIISVTSIIIAISTFLITVPISLNPHP